MIASYQIELTIPPNTPEARPIEKVVSLGLPLIQSIGVLFPSGCLAAVGVRLIDNGKQFLPVSGWLRDDGKLREFKPFYRMGGGGNYRLVIQGYSVALDWPHTITFSLECNR